MEESCLKKSVPGSKARQAKQKKKSGATFELNTRQGSTFVPESKLKVETTVPFDRAKKQRGTVRHLPNGLPN